METETRREKAMNYFTEGYNCAQAVALAFSDLLPLEPETLSRLACSFGGGMGRLREVCGSVSGMLLVLGLLYGYAGPEKGEVKAEQYARVQAVARRFEEREGSLLCRELLGLSGKHDEPTPAARTPGFYKERPCGQLIGDAAVILEAYIREQGERHDLGSGAVPGPRPL